MVRAWIERVYDRGGRTEWFWSLGAGLNSLDFEPASGQLEGGGSYRILTTADDELILSIGAGLRWRLGSRWALEATVLGDQHFAEWMLRDEFSDSTALIDDYFIRGVTVGIRCRF